MNKKLSFVRAPNIHRKDSLSVQDTTVLVHRYIRGKIFMQIQSVVLHEVANRQKQTDIETTTEYYNLLGGGDEFHCND